MKRKRNIITNIIYKWKARLNLHGGQQAYAINYYETFSSVVNWTAAILLFIHSIIYKWHTRQVDFTLAFPQADIELPMYMKLLVGITIKEGNNNTRLLQLKKNLYGQKQGSRVWFLHLCDKLLVLGYITQFFPISTVNQFADIYTKPLPRDLFIKFRKVTMGW